MKTTLNSSLLIFAMTATVSALADETEDYAGLPMIEDTTVPAEFVSINQSGYEGLPVSTQIETERRVDIDGQFDYTDLPIMRRQPNIEIVQVDAFE
jgi:hypothetical protein